MEAGRWNSLWFADHFVPPSPGVPSGDREQERGTAFEGYTLIAVAAGMTEKLKLGHLVLGNTYRNPALLAKMAATLDQASMGRFVLSLGAAGMDEGAGVMFELNSATAVGDLLRTGGWTLLTGVNLMLFSLLHNPCSTTIYIIYKETRSAKWTTVATVLPVAMGLLTCFLVAQVWRLVV